MKKFNYNQCGKYLAKAFKLKVHIQNVHEISIKDLKNTTVMSVQKFHTKYWIEGTHYSCS